MKGQLFVKLCYALTAKKELRGHIAAVDQLRRASLSIVLNIAEGAGRHSLKDKVKYYRTAKGSLFESVAVLDFLFNQQSIPETTYQPLLKLAADVGRMSSGLINRLNQNNDNGKLNP